LPEDGPAGLTSRAERRLAGGLHDATAIGRERSRCDDATFAARL